MNRGSAMLSPCYTPVVYGTYFIFPSMLNCTLQFSYSFFITLMISSGRPSLLRSAYIMLWFIVSKAFTRSIKRMWESTNPCWCLRTSAIFRVWSASWHPTWPNWLLGPKDSKCLRSLHAIIELMIFTVISFKHMPLQLLRFCISSFPLNRLTHFCIFHDSIWRSSSIQYCVIRPLRKSTPSSGEFFSKSVVSSDQPGALLFSIFLISSLISFLLGGKFGVSFIGHWSNVSRIIKSIGAFLLKTFS